MTTPLSPDPSQPSRGSLIIHPTSPVGQISTPLPLQQQLSPASAVNAHMQHMSLSAHTHTASSVPGLDPAQQQYQQQLLHQQYQQQQIHAHQQQQILLHHALAQQQQQQQQLLHQHQQLHQQQQLQQQQQQQQQQHQQHQQQHQQSPNASLTSSASSQLPIISEDIPGHPNNLIGHSPNSPSSEPLVQEVYECPLSATTVAWRQHFSSIQSQLKRELFTLGDTLGTGTFGRVRLVHYNPVQAIAAIRAAGATVPEQQLSPHAQPIQPSLGSPLQPAGAQQLAQMNALGISPLLLQSPTAANRSASMLVTSTSHQLAAAAQANPAPGPRYFALKMLKKSEILRLKQVEHIKAEKAILSRIAHPYIISLYASFQDEHNVFMCMEYVIGGELFSQLRKVGRFSNDTARFYAAEIVLALQYLHHRNIVYRDLKPENLLIDSEGHIKITDFGFAKVVEDRTWTLCGTPEYLAPEIIQSKGHNKAVDWWALGILIFEMLAGYPPFYDENPFGIYQKILAGKLEFPKSFDPVARDLVKKLLQPDRTMRFGCLRDGAEDVKSHRWFRGLDWFRVFTRSYKPPFIPAYRSPSDTSNFDRYPDSAERPPQPLKPHEREQFLDF